MGNALCLAQLPWVSPTVCAVRVTRFLHEKHQKNKVDMEEKKNSFGIKQLIISVLVFALILAALIPVYNSVKVQNDRLAALTLANPGVDLLKDFDRDGLSENSVFAVSLDGDRIADHWFCFIATKLEDMDLNNISHPQKYGERYTVMISSECLDSVRDSALATGLILDVLNHGKSENAVYISCDFEQNREILDNGYDNDFFKATANVCAVYGDILTVDVIYAPGLDPRVVIFLAEETPTAKAEG